MRIKKYVISVLLGLTMSAFVLPVFVTNAVELDLFPDETEDALCSEMNDSTGGILSCGETSGDITSFTEYDGAFEAPDASAYDEGLTKAKSAREFILNVTNFALSFLGLIAVVVIIYGGFLYVTAGGQEEQSGKGKKTLLYAVMGILLILSSYAIVNTLIGEAAGGGEDRGEGTLYSTGEGVEGSSVDVYNVNTIATELQSIAAGYMDIFTTYSNVYVYIKDIKSYEAPVVEDVNALFGIDGDAADEDSIRAIREYLEIVNQDAVDIQNIVDQYSTTYEAAEDLKQYTEQLIYLAQPLNNYSSDGTSYVEKYLASLVPYAKAGEYSYYDYSEFRGYQGTLSDYIGALRTATATDFNEKMTEYYNTISGFMELFEVSGADLSGITTQFNTVITHFTAVSGDSREDGTDNEFISSSVLREVILDLGDLYAMVKDMEFVTAKIEASVSEGNAPLVVSFNGLGSYDPSDETIKDTQYHWDLNGDGKYDTSEDELNKATVSATYRTAGTYRVGLRVTSGQDSTNIAPGQSYLSITVYPPKSQIVFTATTSRGGLLLANYARDNSISGGGGGGSGSNNTGWVNETRAKFTLAEGEAGIDFSLEGTLDGNGDPVAKQILDCGQGNTFESESDITETCIYAEEGTYKVTAEVTDVIGNVDRYICSVYIASPAARIKPSSYSTNTVIPISLDGTLSSTDIGNVVDYLWTATKEDGEEIDLGSGGNVEALFDKPGKYTISLTVKDSSGEEDTDTTEVMVESRAPVARFLYNISDGSQPGKVSFNAKDSYDPDPGDTISYLWSFSGVEGTDYQFVDGTDSTSEKPIVLFSTKGEKDVTLTVSDQYEDEDLKKTTILEDTVTIDSVLDIGLETPMGVAYQINSETAKAEVNLTAVSKNAVAFEIDYGDGESDASENISGGSTTFTHSYTTAGNYYVTLIAYDEEDNENTYTKKIYIGKSGSTISVISIQKDDIDISMDEIEGNINSVFSFDASQSKNSDGTSRNMVYSWDFGDNTKSTEKKANHTYEEVGSYTVKLTVSDDEDPTINSQDSFILTIKEEPPVINSLTYTINSDSLTTPVEVALEADAEDKDGSVANYYWYYYDTTDTIEELGAQITTTPKVTMTIPTNGSSGEEKEYSFVVEVTDLAGNTVSSKDVITESPTITVTNGENEAPVSQFSVSDTMGMLGDTFTLSSTSYDPDGGELTYVWDTEEDGFTDNEESDSSTYEFTPEMSGCYKIKLKVTDDMGQSTVSQKSTEICVESTSVPPEAAFTYTVDGFSINIKNNSKFDTANGAEPYAYQWDFNDKVDSDGNGGTTGLTDDIDSEESDPTYAYDGVGSYKVTLTVYDTAGNQDVVQNTVVISDTEPPTAAFQYETEDLIVNFTDNSTTDGSDIAIVSYAWDLDASKDSDGDGDKTNDVDSTSKDPSYTYEAYGTYTVKLTVLDSMNKEDFVTRTVEVKEPVTEIIGYVNPSIAPSPSDGKIHLQGISGTINISYSTNLENGEGVTCSLDKNVYFDTNGDGIKDNDHDYEDKACLSGTFKDVYFDKTWGMVVMMLTVEDEYGNSYQVTKEITFDTTTGGANIFPVSSTQGLVLIMVAFSFALLGISIYTVKKID